jgi:phosphoribosyl-AMP cyclohydrolase
VAQQHDSGEVLMMAWMNRDSIAETLATGRVCYWSRSRQAFWRKGETSGHVQMLTEMRIDCDGDTLLLLVDQTTEMRIDCDGDTLLLLVDQTGPACHTNRRNCFYRAVRDGDLVTIAEPEG